MRSAPTPEHEDVFGTRITEKKVEKATIEARIAAYLGATSSET